MPLKNSYLPWTLFKFACPMWPLWQIILYSGCLNGQYFSKIPKNFAKKAKI